MSLTEKIKEFNTVAKSSQVTDADEARKQQETNPNRARIKASIANLKSKLFKNVK